MFVGSVLIILGILMLLDRLGIIHGDLWDYFWPILVIALGISFMFKDRKEIKP